MNVKIGVTAGHILRVLVTPDCTCRGCPLATATSTCS